MKKFIVMYVLLTLMSINSYSQLVTYDSLRVMLASNQYSFKNPKFYNSADYALGYSFLVYEKWDSLNSNIAVRKVYFDSIGTEVMITNNPAGQNINPSLSDNILVWQSNVTGNWDINYSVYSSNVWSVPVVLVNTSVNETDPVIYSNRTGPIQYSFYYLAYLKNNDVYFKSYRVNTSTWYPDTNVTSNISYNCITPCFGYATMASTRKLYFNMVLNDTVKRIYSKIFTENYTTGIVSWDTGSAIYQPKTQENLRMLSNNCVYEYDTLGNTHTISMYKDVYTFQLSGKNSGSTGTDFGIITNNPVYWRFASFASVNKRNDSTALKVTKNLTGYSPPNENSWKSFYLGNSSVNSRISVSTPVIKFSYFKLITVCEKMLNGKTALYATYMTDLASRINNENDALTDYSLGENFPNPFNPVTKIKFTIPSLSFPLVSGGNPVLLKIYDITGREVQTLVNQRLQPGSYEVMVDGSFLSSGVYFYRLTAGDFSETKRMVLVK